MTITRGIMNDVQHRVPAQRIALVCARAPHSSRVCIRAQRHSSSRRMPLRAASLPSHARRRARMRASAAHAAPRAGTRRRRCGMRATGARDPRACQPSPRVRPGQNRSGGRPGDRDPGEAEGEVASSFARMIEESMRFAKQNPFQSSQLRSPHRLGSSLTKHAGQLSILQLRFSLLLSLEQLTISGH